MHKQLLLLHVGLYGTSSTKLLLSRQSKIQLGILNYTLAHKVRKIEIKPRKTN